MKRITALLLAILLLAGCGQKEAEAPAAEAPVEQNPVAATPSTDAPVVESAGQEDPAAQPIKEFERFYLEYEGESLMPGEPYTESRFTDLADPETVPDCRTDGSATTYTYSGLTLQTAILSDPEEGVQSEPFINSLEIKDASVTTPEGITLGSTVEELLEAYGSGYTEQFGAYVYTAGECCLYAYPDEAGETVRYLIISLSEEALGCRLEAFLAANGEPTVEMVFDYDDSGNYSGIHFEGLETRFFKDYKAYRAGRKKIASKVKAYDEYGNEIPVTYKICTSTLLSYCKWGPGLVILTAKDSEGHTAKQWMSFFIERYGAADKAVIEKLAEETGDDLVEIKNYVRSLLRYQTEYEGRAVISKSYKKGAGNCYSYARILQTLLEYKGYHAIVIWSEGGKHNWVLVETEEGWRHLDATGGNRFPESEGLMTDTERAATHGNRPWNTKQFPAAR